MARSVIGGISSGSGGVDIALEPPLEFIHRQIGLFRLALEDLVPLWDRFSDVMEQIEQEQFDTAAHGTWPALAEATVGEKQRLGYPDQILVRTGALMASLTDPNLAAEKTARTMTWGSDVPYAVYHQQGTSKMPQRQVISDPFRVEDRRKLEAAMITWINEMSALTFGRIQAA